MNEADGHTDRTVHIDAATHGDTDTARRAQTHTHTHANTHTHKDTNTNTQRYTDQWKSLVVLNLIDRDASYWSGEAVLQSMSHDVVLGAAEHGLQNKASESHARCCRTRHRIHLCCCLHSPGPAWQAEFFCVHIILFQSGAGAK